jgi:hypothetical protein
MSVPPAHKIRCVRSTPDSLAAWLAGRVQRRDFPTNATDENSLHLLDHEYKATESHRIDDGPRRYKPKHLPSREDEDDVSKKPCAAGNNGSGEAGPAGSAFGGLVIQRKHFDIIQPALNDPVVGIPTRVAGGDSRTFHRACSNRICTRKRWGVPLRHSTSTSKVTCVRSISLKFIRPDSPVIAMDFS